MGFNMSIHEELAAAGIVVYKPKGCDDWWVHAGNVLEDGKHFKTYDEARANAVSRLPVKSCKFSGTVRYNRGLGIEYFNLPLPVEAASIPEAQEKARLAAESYVQTTPGMEKAAIQEVKIRPIMA
jgi:hypothetical protein